MFQEPQLNKLLFGTRPPTKEEENHLNHLKEKIIAKKWMEYGSWHGAMLHDSRGRIINIGINFISKTRNGHAESLCFQSIYPKFRLATLYIVRVGGNDNKFANSAPCHKCFKIIKKFMRKKMLHKVIFTLDSENKIFSFNYKDIT